MCSSTGGNRACSKNDMNLAIAHRTISGTRFMLSVSHVRTCAAYEARASNVYVSGCRRTRTKMSPEHREAASLVLTQSPTAPGLGGANSVWENNGWRHGSEFIDRWKRGKKDTTTILRIDKKSGRWRTLRSDCGDATAVKWDKRSEISSAWLLHDGETAASCHPQYWPSRVKVPVLVIKYSLTATSLPDSLPYPLSLIPPNGLSAADELPTPSKSAKFAYSCLRSKNSPVLIPIIPASRFSNNLHVLSTFFVK